MSKSKKLSNVRKVKFGLAVKISAVMILAVIITSLLISLVVIRQNLDSIQGEMKRLGSTILKASYDDAQKYFTTLRNIKETDSPAQRADYSKQAAENLKGIAAYFANLVSETRLLDITFLIENTYFTGTEWDEKKNSSYIYFERKQDRVKFRKNEDQPLKFSIYQLFINNISIEPELIFSPSGVKDKEDFVIIGYPVFLSSSIKKLYSDFNEFITNREFGINEKSSGKNSQKETDYAKAEKEYEEIFIKRLAYYNNSPFNYSLTITSEKDIDRLYLYFSYYYKNYRRLKRNDRNAINSQFFESVTSSIRDGHIDTDSLKSIYIRTAKKFNLELNTSIKPDNQWKYLYILTEKYKIERSAGISLEKLALESYRTDLQGIIGLFLLRTEFFREIDKNRTEIINLALSIALRCIIIALFLPLGILRSVNKLAEDAEIIGKGDFDHVISLKGSDELGRLADILNIMTLNLKKARDSIIEKQRMENELKTAEQIQKALLPDSFPDIKNMKFSSYYAAQSESGGDYYDVIRLSDSKIAVVIADVSGHGVGSGLVMAMTRTLIHTYSDKIKSPYNMMTIINDYLHRNTASNFFVSMFYGIIDTDSCKISYISAGHNPGVLKRKSSLNEIPGGGIALGAVSNDSFEKIIKQKSLQLEKNDILILYTDGIVEAMNSSNEEYGEERFHDVLKSDEADIEKITLNIVDSVNKFTGKNQQSDDISMLLIKIV